MLDKGLEMVCEGARTRATTGSLASQPKVPLGNNTWLLDYSFLFTWLHFQNFLPAQIPHHPQGREMNNGKHDKPRLHKSLIHSEANICLHLTIHVLENLVEQGCKQWVVHNSLHSTKYLSAVAMGCFGVCSREKKKIVLATCLIGHRGLWEVQASLNIIIAPGDLIII